MNEHAGIVTTCRCGHDAGSHDRLTGYCRAKRTRRNPCGCRAFDGVHAVRRHATGRDEKPRVVLPGVGMPAILLLDEFGSQVWHAFGHPPYHVGSSLCGKQWRDVDVRLILSDEEYAALGLGDPTQTHRNGKWVSLCLAYSELGKALTGLPIDFQIQQRTHANAEYDGPRSALGLIPLRFHERDVPPCP